MLRRVLQLSVNGWGDVAGRRSMASNVEHCHRCRRQPGSRVIPFRMGGIGIFSIGDEGFPIKERISKAALVLQSENEPPASLARSEALIWISARLSFFVPDLSFKGLRWDATVI